MIKLALVQLTPKSKTIKKRRNWIHTICHTKYIGDPIEAREVLEDAERHTYELEDLMKRIPPMYEELNETFPDQLKEIEEGYNQLLADDYVFPEQNFAEEIQHAKNVSRIQWLI